MRFIPENHSNARSPFARDRARILHSFAFRRLAQKTQVLSPQGGLEFARNRLTHSLEVSQIGRQIANFLNLDEDLVDAACLSHDLGHPPFGHNGERVLNAWMKEDGGFESNAQTFRILTRLEAKIFDREGKSCGLNLCKQTLAASCKYPWGVEQAAEKNGKFGVYEDDLPIFDWMRQGRKDQKPILEAAVMDIADDISYCVHDLEDAIFFGNIAQNLLSGDNISAICKKIQKNNPKGPSCLELERACERLMAHRHWPKSFSGSFSDIAQLKNFASFLIGRFVDYAVETLKARKNITDSKALPGHITPADRGILQSHQAAAGAPNQTSADSNFLQKHTPAADELVEIEFLKGFVFTEVMESALNQKKYKNQEEFLLVLLDAIQKDAKSRHPILFDPDLSSIAYLSIAKVDTRGRNPLQNRLQNAILYSALPYRIEDFQNNKRAIVDFIASQTDRSVVDLYEILFGVPYGKKEQLFSVS